MSKALQEFTRISRYSRFLPEKKRRETWEEQVDRVFDQMHAIKYAEVMEDIAEEYEFAKDAVLQKKVLGSQRALQFGGPAILNKHARMYNCIASFCSFPRMFQETMWLLLCGCGVGFSVQKHHVDQLPEITPIKPGQKTTLIVVEDSIEGWADSLGQLLSSYFTENQPFPEYFGKDLVFDFSQIRPKGSPISYMGGTAPGAAPLEKALGLIEKLLDDCIERGQKKLRPIDAHDIICNASDAVLAGGIRRSALISVFSPDDEEMVKSKTGNWFIDNPQRGRANNSALLLRNETKKEDFARIMESVKNFGEPGFVWSDSTEIIYNPCCEISLYPVDEKTGEVGFQACNLCEINMKDIKSPEEFYDACRAGAILGTLQAGYTKFAYLSEASSRIIQREALLGVSMTGMCDNPNIAFNPEVLSKGATIVKEVNKQLAKKIGINPSARTTCVKPAGSTSCILGTSSGIHPAHAKKYFRRVQVNKLEEPGKFFAKHNPDAVEESVWSANKTDNVVTFLCETPPDALTKTDVDALKLLKFVKLVQENWVQKGRDVDLCVKKYLQHNVSNTISVAAGEWSDVTNFIYDNRENFAGVSLLPASGDKLYRQAPFEQVKFPDELVREYGNASIFSSGVIIHALNAFGDLFDACDAVLGMGKPLDVPDFKNQDLELENQIDVLKNLMDKRLFVERAKKFARRYFNGDLQKMTYCLKDVNAFKKWCDLKRTYVDVSWIDFTEKKNNVKISQTVACSGGACELVRM